MKLFSAQCLNGSACAVGLFLISSCGRKGQDAQREEESSVDAAKVSETLGDSNEITGLLLLDKLGEILPAPTQLRLDEIGELVEIPEAATEPLRKAYVLGLRADRRMVVHLGKDEVLISFGFVAHLEQLIPAEEQQLLSGFDKAEDREVTVMDEKFDPVKMRIQVFGSKTSPEKKAVIYAQGSNRTVAFFDSSRVQLNKLLPASPETMDPEMLKQLKALIKPTE